MLTGSLARDGQGGMTAVLPLANTGFTYLTDPNTGMRRSAADTQIISAGGVDTITVTTTGATVAGTLDVSGAISQFGHTILPVGLIMLYAGQDTAPSGWLFCSGQTVLRADYPALWTFAAAALAGSNTLFTNGNGTTTFTVPDFRGRIPAAPDGGAGRLTATTMTPDGTKAGSVGGTQTHTLTAAQIPSITSAVASIAVSVLSAFANIVNGNLNGGVVFGAGAGSAPTSISAGSSQITSNGTVGANTATSSNTSGQAHLNVQPTIIVPYIIYTGT